MYKSTIKAIPKAKTQKSPNYQTKHTNLTPNTQIKAQNNQIKHAQNHQVNIKQI